MSVKISDFQATAANFGQLAPCQIEKGKFAELLKELIQLLSTISEDLAVAGLSANEKGAVQEGFSRSSGRTSSGAGKSSHRAGAHAGPAQFLWKPVSDSTGKLAILLPPQMTGAVKGVSVLDPQGRVIENGRDGGVGNGGREHFRFSRVGSAFPPGSQVAIQMTSGAVQKITIEKPGVRTEGR